MKPANFSIAQYVPVLLLLVFLSFFAHLGSVPLFDPDEGAYSEVTREMTVNQDFTTPLLNGTPFFYKPPLFFWAQAASMKILGLTEFSLRLPSAIAALLWVASIFLFTRRFYDTMTAWYSALFMSASLYVTLIGRAAAPEALAGLFITLILLNIYRFYHTGNKKHIYWSFMFAALGVLTRGTIAIILPAVVGFIFFGFKKRWLDLLRLFFNPVGLLVFGLIVMPRYLAEYLISGKAVLGNLFPLPGKGPSHYFIGGGLPYYSYPVLIFIGLLPFSAVFLKALFRLKKLLADELIQFLCCWFLLSLLFLPLVQPKSLLSIAGCLPPLFIIMAKDSLTSCHPAAIFSFPLLFLILLFFSPYLAQYSAGSLQNESVSNALLNVVVYPDTFYLMTLVAIILLFTILPFVKPVPLSLKLSVLGLLFVSIIHFMVLPLLANIVQQPIKSAALMAKRNNLKVVTRHVQQPSFNLYAEMLTEERHPNLGDTVLTKSAFRESFGPYETLFEKYGVLLIRLPKTEGDKAVGSSDTTELLKE